MIDEHRDAAVGTLLCEPRLFLNVLADVDALEDVVGLAVGLLQLLEDDGSFVTCATESAQSLDVPSALISPLGVPKVSSSRPLLAIKPLGRDMLPGMPLGTMGSCFVTVSGMTLTRCRAVWWRRRMGERNMRANRKSRTNLYIRRMEMMRAHMLGKLQRATGI